jgi:hypothetical protein
MLSVLLLPLIVAALFFSAKAIMKQFGSPLSADNAMKWGVVLLVAALIYTAVPQAVQSFVAMPIPSPDALALAIPLGYLVLVVYGYLHLRRDFWDAPAAGREERLSPRHPAPPPPPQVANGQGHAPPRFRTVNDDDSAPS